MTSHDKDKIIDAAKEADPGFSPGTLVPMSDSIIGFEAVERFYAIAFESGRQAEREECAILVEDSDSDGPDPRDLADAIRARGDTK